MKVGNKLPNAMQNAEAAKSSKLGGAEAMLEGKKSGKAAISDGVTSASSARVDLSPRAADMAKAKALATPSESIDEAKVARLQKMIDEGKYKVNAEAIADRLLDEHMKMP